MTRSALLFIALFVGTFSITGCGGGEQTVDKPTAEENTEEGYEAMSEADQAEYDKEMAKEMGN